MSISIMSVKLWNRLDANVRIVKTIHIFNHIINENAHFFICANTNAELCL